MKIFLPVILILATLVLSACGTQKVDTGKSINEESPKVESSMSLKDLLRLGTSQKCIYEINNDDEKMKVEVIVSGKKFKQTTEIINKEGKMKVYAISDGTYYYSWSDAMKGNGTKMNIADLEKDSVSITGTAKNSDKTEEQKISLDEKIDYVCSPANLTESDLALPTNVKFVDYTEMMKSLQNGNLEGLKGLIPTEGE